MEITKIPEKVDLLELYKNQGDMIENPEYENYFKYLTKYFQRQINLQMQLNYSSHISATE